MIKINKVLKLVAVILAITSCSSIKNKENKEYNEINLVKSERPELIILKKEDTPLNTHTIDYPQKNMKFIKNSGYLYQGESAKVPQYLDSVKRVIAVEPVIEKKKYYEGTPEYEKYEEISTNKEYFGKIGTSSYLETERENGEKEYKRLSSNSATYHDFSAKNQKFYKKGTEFENGERKKYWEVEDIFGGKSKVEVTIFNDDTGETQKVILDNIEIDWKNPVADFLKSKAKITKDENGKVTYNLKYKDFKDKYDNGRVDISFDTASNKIEGPRFSKIEKNMDFGDKSYTKEEGTLYDLDKYENKFDTYGKVYQNGTYYLN